MSRALTLDAKSGGLNLNERNADDLDGVIGYHSFKFVQAKDE